MDGRHFKFYTVGAWFCHYFLNIVGLFSGTHIRYLCVLIYNLHFKIWFSAILGKVQTAFGAGLIWLHHQGNILIRIVLGAPSIKKSFCSAWLEHKPYVTCGVFWLFLSRSFFSTLGSHLPCIYKSILRQTNQKDCFSDFQNSLCSSLLFDISIHQLQLLWPPHLWALFPQLIETTVLCLG